MAHYTARATRDEGWWTVTVDEIDGLFTQTRRLEQIPGMVKDALELFPELDDSPQEADVTVVPQDRWAQVCANVARTRTTATQARSEATRAMTEAAQDRADSGLSCRDIGTLLNISFQRAQKLVQAGR